jgi:hypothetical protein
MDHDLEFVTLYQQDIKKDIEQFITTVANKYEQNKIIYSDITDRLFNNKQSNFLEIVEFANNLTTQKLEILKIIFFIEYHVEMKMELNEPDDKLNSLLALLGGFIKLFNSIDMHMYLNSIDFTISNESYVFKVKEIPIDSKIKYDRYNKIKNTLELCLCCIDQFNYVYFFLNKVIHELKSFKKDSISSYMYQ